MGLLVFSIDGIVIREQILNDNDKLLTVLTGEKGKMTVLARGIKAIGSKRSAGAQLFCYSTFTFVERNGRNVLDEIIVKDSFQELSRDVESLALASYFAEFANRVCMEENDEAQMLRLVLNCIYALARTKASRKMIKAAFEMQAMVILGFMPNFQQCTYCSSRLDENSQQRVFNPVSGGFICDKCSSQEDFTLPDMGMVFHNDVYLALKYLCFSSQREMLKYPVNPKLMGVLTKACERYSLAQVEYKCPTLDYYNKNF